MTASSPQAQGSSPSSSGRAAPELVERAIALMLDDEPEAALRWAAAALDAGPPSVDAIVITSRLVDRLGHPRAAVEGLRVAARQAIEEHDLPLAVVAAHELRELGAEVGPLLDEIAASFCRGSLRPRSRPALRPASAARDLTPWTSLLSGAALASRATRLLQSTGREVEAVSQRSELGQLGPVPFFGDLSRDALRALLETFEALTVPAGHRLVTEGAPSGGTVYFVATGELEVSRRPGDREEAPRDVLGRIRAGALVGAVALHEIFPEALAAMLAPATVAVVRPSMLIAAGRAALETVAARQPEVGLALAAHARKEALVSLGWSSPVVASIPASDRAAIADSARTKVFERGERLVRPGEEAPGVHFVVSGQLAVVARDSDEPVLLASLGAGETCGEAEVILCHKAAAEVVAAKATATLYLARADVLALVRDSPAILHSLYAAAVTRHRETLAALQATTAPATDDCLFDEPETRPTRAYGAAAPPPLPAAALAAAPVAHVPPSTAPAPVPIVAPTRTLVLTPTPPPVATSPRRPASAEAARMAIAALGTPAPSRTVSMPERPGGSTKTSPKPSLPVDSRPVPAVAMPVSALSASARRMPPRAVRVVAAAAAIAAVFAAGVLVPRGRAVAPAAAAAGAPADLGTPTASAPEPAAAPAPPPAPIDSAPTAVSPRVVHEAAPPASDSPPPPPVAPPPPPAPLSVAPPAVRVARAAPAPPVPAPAPPTSVAAAAPATTPPAGGDPFGGRQ